MPADPAAALDQLRRELRDLRGASGMSLRELARCANYSASALCRATTGPKQPSWAVVQSFVQACGGPLERFDALWQAAYAPDIEVPARIGLAAWPGPGPGKAVRSSRVTVASDASQ